METVSDFILVGSKITVDSDCSYKTKRHLLLERIVMPNLNNVLKSMDITLPTKAHIAKLWQRRLRAEELMLSNCGAREDS